MPGSVEITPQLAVHSLDFNVGDWVTRYDSAFPGRIVAVHPSIDQVDVEYPTGWEREDPMDLITLPVFHDSLGTTRHNVLLLSRINQNLRSKHVTKNGQVDKFFPVLSKEDQLNALGKAFLDSSGSRKEKIASVIKKNFTLSDWNSFMGYQKRIAKIVLKKKVL